MDDTSNKHLTSIKDESPNNVMEQIIETCIANPDKPRSHQDSVTKTRQALVVANPHSGRGKSHYILGAWVYPLLYSHNIQHDLFVTEARLGISDYLKNITDLDRFELIIVIAGDGTVHEIVNALMSRQDWEKAIQIPIAIIPTGSGNGLAYTIINHNSSGHKPDFERAMFFSSLQISSRMTCKSDLVKITYGSGCKIWSMLSFGWGLLADIDIDSEWLRRLGEFRFSVYGLLRSITSKSHKCQLSYKLATTNPSTIDSNDSQQNNTPLRDPHEDQMTNSVTIPGINCSSTGWTYVEDKISCVYAVHQAYVSRVTKFAPKSTFDDGLIYLTYIIGKLTPCKIIKFLLAIEDGSHDQLPYVTVVPVTEFKFLPSVSSRIVVDGEVIPWNLSDGPLLAEVVPNMLTLRVAKD